MSPLVSVIIPTYNRASVLAATIQNVLEQTYSNFELIVVDDGSTDNTPAVLEQFGNRIRILRQTNSGPGAARNRGLAAARGTLIAFQDSDDSWDPTKLERQVLLLEKAGPTVSCCLCNARVFYRKQKQLTSFGRALLDPPSEEGVWTNVAEVLASGFVLFNQCSMIRTESLRRIGGFNESMRFMEDYDLALRLAIENPCWAFIRSPLATWRQGSPSSLYEVAMQRRTAVRQYAIQARETALQRLADRLGCEELRRLLGRELIRDRRILAVERLIEDYAPKACLGGLIRATERFHKAVYPHFSRYPEPEFSALAATPA